MSRIVYLHTLIPALAIGVILSAPVAAQDLFRPLSLSGKVAMADGTAPPEQTIVELWCDGQRQPQEHTDREGKFNFRIGGQQSRGIADSQRQLPGAAVGASGSDRSFVSLTSCELQASLPGYNSTKIYLGRRSVFESSDVGTLVLRPVAKGEGSFISANTLAAPKDAKKAFDNGQKELSKNKPNPERLPTLVADRARRSRPPGTCWEKRAPSGRMSPERKKLS